MRALVLGGAGMLGHRLWRELDRRMEAHVAVRRSYADYAPLSWFDERRVIDRVDVTTDADLERAFSIARPDVVLNAVGVVKQHRDVDDSATTIEVNALLPHRLAARCAAIGARLIHVSTDCVFSGARGNYAERDVPDATDLYGRSKLLGEVEHDRCLTIRTSMVGREIGSARGLLEWFLSRRGQTVPGFARARFSGLTTLELSRVLADIAERHTDLRGVWHVAAEGECTWAEFARAIFEEAGLSTRVREITTEDLGRPAPRPAYSVLRSERDGAPRLPHWREGLRACLERLA